MSKSKGILAIGWECLVSAAESAVDTYEEFRKPEESMEDLMAFLREEELLSGEGADPARVDIQLGDVLAGDYDTAVGDPHRLVANELILSSKVFIVIAIDDLGSVRHMLDLRDASAADVAGCQVTCAQLADSLYEQITGGQGTEESGEEEGPF